MSKTRSAPQLYSPVFEIRYAFGCTYLDQSGQAFVDLQRHSPPWRPTQVCHAPSRQTTRPAARDRANRGFEQRHSMPRSPCGGRAQTLRSATPAMRCLVTAGIDSLRNRAMPMTSHMAASTGNFRRRTVATPAIDNAIAIHTGSSAAAITSKLGGRGPRATEFSHPARSIAILPGTRVPGDVLPLSRSIVRFSAETSVHRNVTGWARLTYLHCAQETPPRQPWGLPDGCPRLGTVS